MGLVFKARGNASFGLFLIRLTLGSLFLISGATKILNLEGFIEHVKSLHVLPDNLAFIFGFVLPFAEVFFGALYIIGLFTPFTSFFLSLMITGILITLGAGDSTLPYSYNFIFLACTVATMFSGAGLVSFDALLDRKKKDDSYTVTQQNQVRSNNRNNFVVHKEVVKEVIIEPEDVEEVKDTIYPNNEERKDI